MNARRCLRIAERIGALLEQEIGIGIEAERMLTDRLYLRDVLLVCEAHRGHELAELARWFRRSAAEMPAGRAAALTATTSGFGDDSVFPGSGFGSSFFDSLRDPNGPGPLRNAAERPAEKAAESAAELVRRQLDQQRAAALLGGQRLAARTAATRSA